MIQASDQLVSKTLSHEEPNQLQPGLSGLWASLLFVQDEVTAVAECCRQQFYRPNSEILNQGFLPGENQ